MPLSKANIDEIVDAVSEEGGVRFQPAPLAKPPADLPASWIEILTSKEPTNAVWDVLWKPMAKELPKTIRTFKKALQGIGLLTTKTRPPSLVYVVTEDGSDTYGWRGFAAGPVKHPEAKKLPPEFLKFYQQTHNGWGFLDNGSLGPLPVEHWYMLSEDEQSPSGKFLVVFHNGGGAHLGFDLTEDPPICYTVWPDDKPEVVPDLWRTIDKWIVGQNEDLDPA
jgi:hypothetical protein